MRYRIHDRSGCVGHFVDRDAYNDSFLGDDPNNPVDGVIRLDTRLYFVIGYKEYHSSGFTENEFHEIENDWFGELYVKPIDKDMFKLHNPLRERMKPICVDGIVV